MPKRASIETFRKLAESKGGALVSEVYRNNHTKLTWRCSEGHTWDATPHHVKDSGSWCPVCANKVPLTLEDAHQAAIERSGRCLSREFTEKLHWECACGHKWYQTLTIIRSGCWCPACAKKTYTLKDMQERAAERGGKCLSTVYAPIVALHWQCAEGHEWSATPTAVRKSWCPTCAGRRQTIADMQKIAASKGGKCLSEKYLGVQKNLTWQCAKGHIWEATPLNVRLTSWCPECKHGKRERECRTIFEALTGKAFPKSRPEWLRSHVDRQMELDGYCEELGTAFEYQGFQHYKQCYFHRGPEDFENQQLRDEKKRTLCAEHKVKLIEIPWRTRNLRAFIAAALIG